MLSVNEIREKVLRYWRSGKVPGVLAAGEDCFPIRIPWGLPTAKKLQDDFAAIRENIADIRRQSGPGNMGYRIEWKEINHRRLGRQQIPAGLLFDQPGFLHCTGKEQEYSRFINNLELIRTREPKLEEWLVTHPMEIILHDGKWPQLLSVINWFKVHPRPRLFLRQLDIPGVDTKFIERHKKIIADLIVAVLPGDMVCSSVKGLANHGFERKFALKFDEPLIRLRYLDPAISPHPACLDISLPLSGFKRLNPLCQRVFITENKINGLSFPPVAGSIIIFGLGYGIRSLQGVDWLKNMEIIYWGDIDTHGFSILSALRSFLPQASSFLMDKQTLFVHQNLWGREEDSKRRLSDLNYLNEEEKRLYNELVNNIIADNLRLEQERIGFTYLEQRLQVTGARLQGTGRA